MKIVHIVMSLLGGGIQNFLLSLLPEQAKQGNDVTLIVIDRYLYDYCQKLEDTLTSNGVKVIRLNKIVGNKWSYLKTITKCRAIVKSIRPDIVNTHGEMSHIFGAFSVKNTDIRQCLTIHNAPEKWNMLIKLLCDNKPMIFCSSAAYTMRLQHGSVMEAIDNGISANIVKTDNIIDIRKELGLKKTDKIVLSVGSLRPQKNYEFLKGIVDALQDPSVHFCICGGNYGNGYIRMSVFDDYPNIHCLGLRSDVSAIENGSDIFLSCAKFEGLPIAVLEAYFNGIPCVLSPIEQHKNISDVEKVWIPENFTAEDFAISIKKALSDNTSHDEIYQLRKKQIEKYSISETSRKYIAFYKKVLE